MRNYFYTVQFFLKDLFSLRLFKRKFRDLYQKQFSLPFGITQFIGAIAYMQLGSKEVLYIPGRKSGLSTIAITASGIRPRLQYTCWVPNGPPATNGWVECDVFVEIEKLQIKEKFIDKEEWSTVTIEDPRLSPLKDLFLSFAFYTQVGQWHKAVIEEKPSEPVLAPQS